jgi:hypothetical protein
MPKKLPANPMLRSLAKLMRDLEEKHQERIKQTQTSAGKGDSLADADRDTAEAALAAVVDFFLDHKIESQPLYRLLCEIAALSAGASPSRMLSPVLKRHRRRDALALELVKGRLAAIMKYQQQVGLSRKAAGQWVIRNIPSKMKRQLRANTQAAVDHWLLKWGGQRGATPGPGRESYLIMLPLLEKLKPTEEKLKRIIAVGLSKSLPS